MIAGDERDEDQGGGEEAEGDVRDEGGMGIRAELVDPGGGGEDDAHEQVEWAEEEDEWVEEDRPGAGEGRGDADAAEGGRGHFQPVIEERPVFQGARPHEVKLVSGGVPGDEGEEEGNAPANGAEQEAEAEDAEADWSGGDGEHGEGVRIGDW